MSFDFAHARDIMVDSQVRPQDVTDLAIQDAMRAAPRESLLPPERALTAYADTEVEYAPGRYLLRPRDIAKLLHGLKPRAGERALAIAAPYAAMVLETMGLDVTRVDGADVKAPPAGSWPLVVSENAVSDVPAAWLAAIAPGGRMGAIVRQAHLGHATLFLRLASGVTSRVLFDCGTPVMPEFRAEPGFVF